ncbi:MAG TPA: ABC transporter permease subunit, partial [Candidatus Paceibacterota bacterium]|nr:ABC transporter permease subunit [Candidatus Paceibacterota bacterium]
SFLFLIVPHPSAASALTFSTVLLATGSTMLRIGAAYVLAVVVAIPVALLIERNRAFETVLLPLFDVLESIPNLAVLPVLVLVFGQYGFLDGAAITILFLNMVWNIVFALVGGLQIIPRDVKDAAHIFGLHGASFVRRLSLPAIVPQFITGSILAVASGWNIIIVAEALHAYIPGGTSAQDLFGIGSILVSASAQGQTSLYLLAFSIMIIVIALFNFFVWQRLLHFSQRFRFD